VRWSDTPADLMRRLAAIEPIVVLPRFLHLQLWLNEGAVFGIGQGQRWLFAAVSIIAVVVIWRVFARSAAGQWGFHLALAAILAGALGNLYDRLRFAAVRDMIHLFPDIHLPFGWTWPGTEQRGLYPWIFNFADMWLVGGVVLLLIITWRCGSAPRPSAAETSRD
jgi:signal peptidase II